MSSDKKPRVPFLPAEYTDAEIAAIKALSKGEATADQQLAAMRWVLQQACGQFDFHYYPSERDTSFALGRAFVSQQIRKLIAFDPQLMGNTRGERP